MHQLAYVLSVMTVANYTTRLQVQPQRTRTEQLTMEISNEPETYCKPS